MNCSKLIAALAVPMFICSAAVAQGVGDANSADAPQVAPTLSRAEVIADLQIWRESGMAAAQQAGDGEPDTNSATYREAEARYTALRRAPSFAARVNRIAAERGEAVVSARAR